MHLKNAQHVRLYHGLMRLKDNLRTCSRKKFLIKMTSDPFEYGHVILGILADKGKLTPNQLEGVTDIIGEATANYAWNQMLESFDDYIRKQPNGKNVRFEKDTPVWSTTRCKKELKLTENDLRVLNYEMIYVYKAKGHFQFFKESDVQELAKRKHTLKGVDAIVTKKDIRVARKSEIKTERELYISYIVSGMRKEIQTVFRSKPFCKEFLSNGKHKKQLKTIKDHLDYALVHESSLTCEQQERFITRSANETEKNREIFVKEIIREFHTEDAIRKYLSVRSKGDFNLELRDLQGYVHDIAQGKCTIEQADRDVVEKKKATQEAAVRREQDRKNNRVTLIAALQKRGLSLRDDSVLCNQYISGNRDDLQHVVDTMFEMDWLYKNTRYGQIYREFVREIRYERRYSHEYETDEEESDPIEVSKMAKSEAVREFKKKYPKRIHEIPVTLS